VSSSSIERALVVRLSSIGDVVHTIPAFMALRRAAPEALLGWAVEPAAAPLVRRLPGPLEVHVLDTHRWRRQWWNPAVTREVREAIAQLRGQRYEVALDCQGLVKSALVGHLSRAPIFGYARDDLREPVAARWYEQMAPKSTAGRHVIWRSLELARLVGATADKIEFPNLSDDRDAEYVDEELRNLGIDRFAAVHAGSNWPAKYWSPLRFAAFGRSFVQRSGLPLIWVWGPGEHRMADALARSVGFHGHTAFPTSLTQLAALLQRADLFVGGDSAPLHLAVASGTPVVGIFGPTDPSRNGPLRDEDASVFHRLPCSFCFQKRCPLGTRQCLQELSVESVVEAALGRLAAARAEAG
jgi:lipopolysaccharide heptosyltransferase I